MAECDSDTRRAIDMSKKGSSSAASDPFAGFSAMMQANAAGQQAALGQNWLDFAKQQFAVSNERQTGVDALTKRVTESQLAAQDQAAGWAAEDRARYKSIFQPMQDKFIDKANNWDSADAQVKAAAEASADVKNAFAAQDAQRQRAMAAKGINPTSGAYAGIERGADAETALAGAGAQNVARNQLRKEAVALQGDALNIGSGLPSQAGDALRLGVGAGSSASGVGLGAEGNFRSNVGIMNSGFQGAGGLYESAGNIWGDLNKTRTSILNGQDERASEGFGALASGAGAFGGYFGKDIMGGLGKLGTSAMAFLSDEDAKEDKREVRGVLDALNKIPVEAWSYKDGEGDGGEHVGAYAQDFKKATGLGDGKSINVIDALGVTMGAVKELAEKVEGMGGTRRARPNAKSIMRRAA